MTDDTYYLLVGGVPRYHRYVPLGAFFGDYSVNLRNERACSVGGFNARLRRFSHNLGGNTVRTYHKGLAGQRLGI